MIVAGERRWQAHRVAKLKEITAVVKEYKNEIDWEIESLVENLQREDLTSTEREKYTYNIWKKGNFKNYSELSKKTGIPRETIVELIEAKEVRAKEKYSSAISTRQIRAVKTLDNETQKKILKKAEQGKIGGEKVLREYSKVIKKAPEEVKTALLDDKINVEQAERISKLKTEPQRIKAIQEHQNISKIEKTVERNIEHQQTASEKREHDKKLVKVNNMILSFKNSVTDVRIELEKSLKILLVNAHLVGVMDDGQKEKFDIQLDRLVESLERGEHIAEQIKDKL